MRLDQLSGRPNNLRAALKELRPALAAAAQQVYDEWDVEIDEMGGGGICDQFSAAIAGVLISNGIDCTEGGHDGDDHSYQIAYDARNAYVVDIDAYLYETGGGYSWTKIEGITFTPDSIQIYKVTRPDWV